MKNDMIFTPAFSPVSLRYIAALRGNTPPKAGAPFVYAQAQCADPEALICLAASNPEGRFFGFTSTEDARKKGEDAAIQRNTTNIVFLAGTPSEILACVKNSADLLPPFDYLYCDENASPLSEAERAALFDLAHECVAPGGLFSISYRAYDSEDGALRFLIQQLSPQVSKEQETEFLVDIKKLGATYFSKHLDLADLLDKAIAVDGARAFFDLFAHTPARSATFETLLSATARGFAYAGDAAIAFNYVEIAVPHEAQDVIESSRQSPLFESIKDFALHRTIRSDIWVKAPREMSSDLAERFGGFAYGLVVDREQVPTSFSAKGKSIDLSSDLYKKLLILLSVLPAGVNDALSVLKNDVKGPEEILEAFQTLVACGFASPMRGIQTEFQMDDFSQPRLVGGFNRFLDKLALTDSDVLLSSEVAGFGLKLPARDAFVMQALNRAGLTDSLSALMPELNRIAGTPAAAPIIRDEALSPEAARKMIADVAGKSLPKWYAYALLEAA
jgi:hypothetical protein